MLAGAGITVGAALVGPAAADADTFPVTSLADDGSPGTLRSAVDDGRGEPRVRSGPVRLGPLGVDRPGQQRRRPTRARSTSVTRSRSSALGRAGSPSTPMPTRGSSMSITLGPPLQVFMKATISGLTLSGGDVAGDPGGAIYCLWGGPRGARLGDQRQRDRWRRRGDRRQVLEPRARLHDVLGQLGRLTAAGSRTSARPSRSTTRRSRATRAADGGGGLAVSTRTACW